MLLNFVKLSTLLIKKGCHERYATLTTLAVVWALWLFKIFFWSELYWTLPKWNALNDEKRSQPLKFLETLLLAIEMCTDFTTAILRMKKIVCSVTGEPSQSSIRCVSFFKDSSALLNIWEVNFTKVKSFKSLAHC